MELNKTSNNVWKSYYVYNDEVIALIELYKDAPHNKKNNIRNIIIKKLSFFTHTKAKKFKSSSFYSDILQEARIGLLTAIEKFDSNRGLNFFILAEWHIKNRIRVFINWNKKNSSICPMKDFSEEIETPEEQYEKKESIKILEKEINNLSTMDKKIISLKYGIYGNNCHTFKQIGDIFSVSRQYIEQRKTQALKKLEKSIKNNFGD